PRGRVEPLVPDQFTLWLDPITQEATVRAYAERCDAVTVDGVTREVIWAAFRVDLADGCAGEPEDSEERTQCESEPHPRVHLDTYQFFIAYNDPDLVRLFQKVGATTKEVVFVEDLIFNLDPVLRTFSFVAPAPTPSPFKISAMVGAPVVGPLDLDLHEWGAVPRGLFKVGDPNDVSVLLGPAKGTLSVEANSEMAKILCATQISDLDEGYRELSWEDEEAGIVSFDSQFAVHAVDSPDTPSSPTEAEHCPKT
ncbi:MAG: hypothetical protein M3O70_21695, partial [Actinomycetota bacterium]|nr:hypothetical protein [Actinomycetota bacterium]